MTPHQWATAGKIVVATALTIFAISLTNGLVAIPFRLIQVVLSKLRLWPVGFEHYLRYTRRFLTMLLVPLFGLLAFRLPAFTVNELWLVFVASATFAWFFYGVCYACSATDDGHVRLGLWMGAIGATVAAVLVLTFYLLPEANDFSMRLPSQVWHLVVKQEPQ